MKIITEKEKELSEAICGFLDSKMIQIGTIEQKCNIPKSTLSRSLKTRNIPNQHIYNIICTLAPYGFKLYGYNLKVDELGHIYGYKLGEKVKAVEVQNFKDGSILEKDIVEITMLDEEMPAGYVSSNFYDLHKVERAHWTCYEDL